MSAAKGNPPAPSGYVALVLHAHLPYVRHPEHARSIEERWLFEAMWEVYLPLVDLLDRLHHEGVFAPISLSVSPPLAAMWQDRWLLRRCRAHFDAVRAVGSRALSHGQAPEIAAAIRHHIDLLDRAETTFERHRGDVLSALVAHHQNGTVELFTTAATHGFLPGLAAGGDTWKDAQIAFGRASFERATGICPRPFWLPECAFVRSVDASLARLDGACTVLDAHGIALAEPRPHVARIQVRGRTEVVPVAPLVSRAGVTYFGRDLWAGRSVWANDGYPSHPSYRELHRDLGFELPLSTLAEEVGPGGVRIATGIRPYRITGSESKMPYDPWTARAQACSDAEQFVKDRARFFEMLPGRGAPPISVVPFDAELFGHFWHEGPLFLEGVLRRLDASASAGAPRAITLSEYMERYPAGTRGEPAASTWGEGGFSATWTGPKTAGLWRHIHHIGHEVAAATARHKDASGSRGEALDQAIVEALLLQSSDFAFMIHRGTTSEYAKLRIHEHSSRASRLLDLVRADTLSTEDQRWIQSVRAQAPLFRELPAGLLRELVTSASK